MSESRDEIRFRCTVELMAELLAMALLSVMMVVSTLRLFGILS